MLLANKGPNRPYGYTWMDDTMAHAPLSTEGHIGIMTDGIPSTNACSCLNQLQVWKLLQCRGQVVCPEGPNGSLKALLFNFRELPLWNVGSLDEPTQDPSFKEVDLSITEPTNTIPVPLPFQLLNLHMTSQCPQLTPPGGFGMAAVDFTCNLSPHCSA